MKRFTIILMSLIFVGVFVITGFTGSSKTRQITGNVTGINRKADTITVEKKNKKVILSVEDKTKIIQCTLKTSITDIKIGDKVTAKYTEGDAEDTARSITIREVSEKVD